jgi:hypothetical protein
LHVFHLWEVEGGVVETLLSILDFAILIVWLAVIPICFLKGRHGFAWFGLFMFGTGAVLSLQGFRYVRDGIVDDWWWWLFNAQGVAVVLLLVSIALRAAKLGSWWDRRNVQHSTEDGQI